MEDLALKELGLKVEEVFKSTGTLADDAKELLGYGTLQHQIENENRLDGVLRKVLRDLKINIFSNQSVERYKKTQIIKAYKSIGVDLGTVDVGEALNFGFSGQQDAVLEYNFYWDILDFSEYSDPIPICIIRRAVAIAKKCKEEDTQVRFQVHYLEKEKRESSRIDRSRQDDPFLSVQQYHRKKYSYEVDDYIGDMTKINDPIYYDPLYIGVWDEPDFAEDAYMP